MGYHAFADLPSSFATREKIYYNPPTMTSFRVSEGTKYPTSPDLVESLSFDQSSMQELPHHESILNGEEGPSFRLTVVADTVGATVTTVTPSESNMKSVSTAEKAQWEMQQHPEIFPKETPFTIADDDRTSATVATTASSATAASLIGIASPEKDEVRLANDVVVATFPSTTIRIDETILVQIRSDCDRCDHSMLPSSDGWWWF
jgi:hypothetical protein